MARPRNPAHHDSLLAAATRTFASKGLGVSTATIAKEAGVSAGTLFTYFETKTVLINELYVALKTEMGRAASVGVSEEASSRDQLYLMWGNWISWATADPDRQRALARLSVAGEITAESHRAVGEAYAGIAALLSRITADGPMRGVPLDFISTLMSAIADATIDDLIKNPDPTGARSTLAFDAMWRALAG